MSDILRQGVTTRLCVAPSLSAAVLLIPAVNLENKTTLRCAIERTRPSTSTSRTIFEDQ
jgi:hypothetical protein